MRKILLGIASVATMVGGAASAQSPWPTISDRSVLSSFKLGPDYDTCSAELMGGDRARADRSFHEWSGR